MPRHRPAETRGRFISRRQHGRQEPPRQQVKQALYFCDVQWKRLAIRSFQGAVQHAACPPRRHERLTQQACRRSPSVRLQMPRLLPTAGQMPYAARRNHAAREASMYRQRQATAMPPGAPLSAHVAGTRASYCPPAQRCLRRAVKRHDFFMQNIQQCR